VSYCVFEPRPAAAIPGDLPTVADATAGSWMRRWGGGRAVLAGVVSEERDVPATVTAGVPIAEQKRVRDVVGHRCPGLADCDVVGGVVAHDAIAPGGKGSVTVWPEPAGLVASTGWNGVGFKLAPAIATHLARRIREVLA